MKRKIIALFLTFILLFSGIVTTVYAVSESDLKDTQNKIDAAQDKKDEIASEKKSIMAEISDLEDDIEIYEAELATLNTKIKKLENDIQKQEKEIVELQEEYEKMQQLLTDRLVAIYEEGQPTFLDILLSADSISAYISGTAMIQQLAEADNEQMDKVEKQRIQVEKAKKELEEQRTELNTSKKSVQAKANQLKVVVASKESKVAKLTASEKATQKEIEKYKAELADIQAELEKQKEQANNVYVGSFSGALSWPLSSSSSYYNVIISKYGAREAPVAGASTYHRGVDIPVRTGTPVYASADGYVLSAKYNSARGYYVLIKHADNLYTLYQHLDSYSVSVGQHVSRGQRIATSGSSGIGSGPHLHYEVWNAYYYLSTVNPLTCGYVSLPNLIYW